MDTVGDLEWIPRAFSLHGGEEGIEAEDQIVSVYPKHEQQLEADKATQEERKRKEAETMAKDKKKVRVIVVLLPIVVPIVVGGLVAILSTIYWSVAMDPFKHLNVLPIAVLNQDTSVNLHGTLNISLGDQVIASVLATNTFTWHVLPATSATNKQDLINMVTRDDVWAALWIPPNFTATFQHYYEALDGVNSSSVYNNPIMFIHDPAKQFSTASVASSAITSVITSINRNWQHQIFEGKLGNHSINAPYSVVYTPIQLSVHSIHAMDHLGWNLATFMTFSFMWIISILAINMVFSHAGRADFHHTKKSHIFSFPGSIAIRYSNCIIVFIVCCGIMTAVLTGFDFPAAHGYGSIYGVLFVTCMAYGGVISLFFGLFGQLGLLLCIVLMYAQLVSCGAMSAPLLLDGFWKVVGPVLPMRHGLALMRYEAFDTMTTGRGEHWGILFAWAIGGQLLSILPQYFALMDPKMKAPKPIK